MLHVVVVPQIEAFAKSKGLSYDEAKVLLKYRLEGLCILYCRLINGILCRFQI